MWSAFSNTSGIVKFIKTPKRVCDKSFNEGNVYIDRLYCYNLLWEKLNGFMKIRILYNYSSQMTKSGD